MYISYVKGKVNGECHGKDSQDKIWVFEGPRYKAATIYSRASSCGEKKLKHFALSWESVFHLDILECKVAKIVFISLFYVLHRWKKFANTKVVPIKANSILVTTTQLYGTFISGSLSCFYAETSASVFPSNNSTSSLIRFD